MRKTTSLNYNEMVKISKEMTQEVMFIKEDRKVFGMCG